MIRVLDTIENITIDTDNPIIQNHQALNYLPEGLFTLARSVREEEIRAAGNPFISRATLSIGMDIPPALPCLFDWFSVSLLSYLKLVGLIGLMNFRAWKTDDLVGKHEEIRRHCNEYVQGVVPEVLEYRSKIGAHPSIADPRKGDTVAIFESSIMGLVTCC